MASLRTFFAASALTLALACSAQAEPGPVDPIEILDANEIRDAQPWGAPGGRQLVTYLEYEPAISLRVIEREDGSDFDPPLILDSGSSMEAPDLSFTPEGGTFATWGRSLPASFAAQAIRQSGGEFEPAVDLSGCRRFVDSAAGPEGGIAVACAYHATGNSTATARLRDLPALGTFSLTGPNDLIQPVYDYFIDPQVVWGEDGTIATAFDQSLTTTNPAPPNQMTRVRVVLRGPGLVDTADLVQVTEPDRVTLGGVAVTPGGRVGVSYYSDAGPVLRVRPPGLAQTYSSFGLPGEEAMNPRADGDGRIHVVSVGSTPGRTYSVNVWTDGNPSMLAPVEIPLAGSPDPYVPYEGGFQVAPDGTEFALIRADSGTYATSRAPGAAAFTTPEMIGPAAAGNPNSTITADGDFLVTWATGEVGDQTLIAGGLDSGKPPVVTVSEFPAGLADGAPGTFSASAKDSMGIRSTEWNFGDGTATSGDTATHSFKRPGNYDVRFIATDRAGNRTVERRTVVVPIGPNSVPTMTVKAPKKLKFRTFGKRGVRIVVTGRPQVKLRAAIGTSKRNARLRPMRVRVVKKFRNRHVLRVKPRRARLGKRRNFRLYVQVTGTTKAGKQATRSRTVRVRR